MINLIAGLGNPGAQYAATRHNAGAQFLRRLADDLGVAFQPREKWKGEIALAGGVRLLRPSVYMNCSGEAVGAVARYFDIAAADILIAHDEVDFAAGDIRLKFGGGEAGHNGLRDITRALGGQDYWRLRIGIGRPGENSRSLADNVLAPPTPGERAAMDDAMGRALAVWPAIAGGDWAAAMRKLHTRPDGEKNLTMGAESGGKE